MVLPALKAILAFLMAIRCASAVVIQAPQSMNLASPNVSYPHFNTTRLGTPIPYLVQNTNLVLLMTFRPQTFLATDCYMLLLEQLYKASKYIERGHSKSVVNTFSANHNSVMLQFEPGIYPHYWTWEKMTQVFVGMGAVAEKAGWWFQTFDVVENNVGVIAKGWLVNRR